MTHGLSALTSFMAVQRLYDLDQGLVAFREQLIAYHDEKAFLFGQSLVELPLGQGRAQGPANTTPALNAHQLSDEVKQTKGLNAAADAYRQASNGG